MRLALSKTTIESQITSRFGDVFKLTNWEATETLSTGIADIDAFLGGLPRGAIAEVFGPASSGRTSFMFSALVHATTHEEVCAVVDTNDVFDPRLAAQAEINLDRLLWIRCGNNLEHAFKATDLLLQAGGFGLVMLDLGDVPAKSAKRIISSWWYRFRRTLEATPTALVVTSEESCVGSRAALALELKKEDGLWSSTTCEDGAALLEISPSRHLRSIPTHSAAAARPYVNRILWPHTKLLRGVSFQVECRRPLYLKNRDVLIRAANH